MAFASINLALSAVRTADSPLNRAASGFVDGFEAIAVALWHVFKAFVVALWHAFLDTVPHHNVLSAYHLGFIVGMVVFVALLVGVYNWLTA